MKASAVVLIVMFLTVTDSKADSLRLRSLQDSSSVNLRSLKKEQNRVFIVFQKQCSACRKQVKELTCLKKVADVVLVGAFSTEAELRKEYKAFSTEIVGLYGDKDFKKRFDLNIEATPQIIVQVGQKSFKVLGLKTCVQIARFIKSKRI